MPDFDLLVLGAGASGLMCAATAAGRGLKVAVLEHNPNPGRKILASGGGRCNFPNLEVRPQDFRSANPHFVKSCLAQYPPSRFLELVKEHKIAFYEKAQGQLFCHQGAREILNLLLGLNQKGKVKLLTGAQEIQVCHQKEPSLFLVQCSLGEFSARNLVVATGGLSYRSLGASDLGMLLARQFGLKVTHTRPALVPLLYKGFTPLAGVSLPAEVEVAGRSLTDDLLFTHQGISGPVVLKASLFWDPGESLQVNLLPGQDLNPLLLEAKASFPQKSLSKTLAQWLPERLVSHWQETFGWPTKGQLQNFSHKELALVAQSLSAWSFVPQGTEGYAKAEVTLGGVSTQELSSKTLEAKKQPGLYFVGELVDMTGLLGGFNLHWAWASGFAAGTAVS